MTSNRTALLSITGYPIPMTTVEAIALRRGLSLDSEASKDTMASKAFRLCEADLLMWLFRAPNISQGGQNYTFTDEQRAQFRRRARAIYINFGDEKDANENGVAYGYKGSRL